MDDLHLTRISNVEMALSLKNGTEGKCLPQNNNKIQNFYGRISKRMQNVQNTTLPFNPYGFFHKDLIINCFIVISGQPKIRADVRIYGSKWLLLKTVWKTSWMEETQNRYGRKFTIFVGLESAPDYGDGLILLLSALFSNKWARRKVGNIKQISMLLAGHGVWEMWEVKQWKISRYKPRNYCGICGMGFRLFACVCSICIIRDYRGYDSVY